MSFDADGFVQDQHGFIKADMAHGGDVLGFIVRRNVMIEKRVI